MSFISPLAFSLTILLPILIAMYLLKLRRTKQVVSSTYLWQRMVRDVEANSPWQRLRRNLLLLIQLLLLLALIFTLARPFTWVEGSSGQAKILIFDTSASMAATDISPNRLEAAKDQARLLISTLPQETHGTIIAAGDTTRVLLSSSQDKRQLHQAIESLKIQHGGSDLTSALSLASAIVSRQQDAEILVYSDGRVDLPERLATQGHIRYLPIGESGNNQAISLITLEPGTSNTPTAFIQVVNYAKEPIQRRLTIRADNRLVDAQDLTIPAQGQVSVISENIPIGTKEIEAKLTESDDLPLDDQAWAVQQVSGIQNVNMVSQGNRFLETALRVLPGIEFSVTSLEEWNSSEYQEADLVIFDNFSPPIDNLHFSNLFYIGPISSTNFFSITGIIDAPVPQPMSETDPLLKHVDLSGVSILDSARIPLPNWARPVLVDENSGDLLLFAGEIERRRVAVLAFNPLHSDLPLQVAYPILTANLVEWLLPGKIGDIPNQIRPGEVVTFTPPPDVTSLTVYRPDGTSTQLINQGSRASYADTTQLGIYRVTWGEEKPISFVVNLSNPQESDIHPNETLSVINRATGTKDNHPQQAHKEWWQPLTAIVLIILLIEWLVYHRATLSKLRNLISRNVKSEM